MPIIEADTTMLKQDCMHCGAGHTVPLWKGYSKSKKGPYDLDGGDTLDVKIDDAGAPITVTFNSGDFADINAALPSEVAAKIVATLVGITSDVDNDAVRIISDSTVLAVSCIEVTGGTAQPKLGFDSHPCGPRVLGVTRGTGAGKRTAPDTIDLPPCPECGARECLVRTWDVCPPDYADSYHSMHRKCVNALAEHLKAQGYSDADAKPTHDAETSSPPDIDPAYPPGPVMLSTMFPPPDGQAGGP